MRVMKTRMKMTLAFLLLAGMAAFCGAQVRFNAGAVRHNNRGVALMGQQFTERAADEFAEALKDDPRLVQAAINEGIALMALEKLEEARKAFQEAIALDPNRAQAWYNLGLLQHANNELEAALASFQRAAQIDPRDVDTLYFEGNCYQEMKQFDKAIDILQKALAIDPLHASAEFALARSLQRTGHTAEAREHFKQFQHLTSNKISSAIGLAYGEEGRYSTVTPVEMPETVSRTMIPVRLVAQPLAPDKTNSGKTNSAKANSGVAGEGSSPFTTTGGACMMDVTGSGQMDLVLMQSGAQAIRVLHNDGKGRFEELDVKAAGLAASGHAIACAVGDYNGDGLNDLAVALDNALLLFRNLGHGRFKDVTAEAGLAAKNRPSGITFVDYDHDGDLDLLLTGSPIETGGNPNVLWRNDGNGSFTEWTEPTGLGGSGKTAAAILTDFNNDRAVDLAVTGDGPSPRIYINPREGKYPTQPLYDDTALPPTTGIAVLDFNKDGWMDIAVTHAGAPGFTLWRNVEGPDHVSLRFERVRLPLADGVRGWGLTPIDIDNDGWIHLAAIVETNARPAGARLPQPWRRQL